MMMKNTDYETNQIIVNILNRTYTLINPQDRMEDFRDK